MRDINVFYQNRCLYNMLSSRKIIKTNKNNTTVVIKRSLCDICSDCRQMKQITLYSYAQMNLIVKSIIILKILYEYCW